MKFSVDFYKPKMKCVKERVYCLTLVLMLIKLIDIFSI